MAPTQNLLKTNTGNQANIKNSSKVIYKTNPIYKN